MTKKNQNKNTVRTRTKKKTESATNQRTRARARRVTRSVMRKKNVAKTGMTEVKKRKKNGSDPPNLKAPVQNGRVRPQKSKKKTRNGWIVLKKRSHPTTG